MGRGQNMNIKKSLEEVDSNPHGWLWEIQDFYEGSNYRCSKIARELELQVVPEDGTELLQAHDKT